MRAILVRYRGPTDTRGARVRVTDPGYASRGGARGARSVTVSWDDALDGPENFAAAARIALQRWGWDGTWVGGGLDSGDAFVCCSPRGPLTVYPDAFAVPVPPAELTEALATLARWATSGERYEQRNPYTIPAVAEALKVLARARGMAQAEWMDAAKAEGA